MMNNKIKKDTVSIIITTYNRDFSILENAILSAINQTYDRKEIIVVDDNNESIRKKLLLEEKIQKYKSIKYIRHDVNKGLSEARNTGIKNSCGEYIAFLDDDDTWDINKIELQVKEFNRNDSSYGLVYSPYIVVYDTNNKQEVKGIPYYKGENTNHLLEEGNYICYPLIRRECFNKIGVFDVNLFHSEDFEMWLRISTEYKFSFIKEPVAYYHNHGTDSMTYNYESFIASSNYIQYKHRNLYNNNKKAKHNIVINRAYTYARAKRLKLSIKTYVESIKICPKNILLHVNSLIHLVYILIIK